MNDVAISMSVILSVLCIIFMIGSISIFIVSIIKLLKLKRDLNDKEFERKQLEEENKRKAIKYTNDILDFVRMLISQVSLLSFKNFKDGHEMTKITKTNIEHLIQDIARTVNESIAIENIMMSDIIITNDFLNKYIVETTIFTIKKMLDDAMIEIEDMM